MFLLPHSSLAYKSLVDAVILEEMKTFENPYKLHEIPPLPSNVVKVSATQKSATSTPSSLQVEIAHKAVEYENLTILNEIGANAWKLNCYHLDRLLNHLEFLVAEKQQAISRLNQERKIAQVRKDADERFVLVLTLSYLDGSQRSAGSFGNGVAVVGERVHPTQPCHSSIEIRMKVKQIKSALYFLFRWLNVHTGRVSRCRGGSATIAILGETRTSLEKTSE